MAYAGVNGLNGLTVIDFAASGVQWLDLQSLASLTAVEIFVVVKAAQDPNATSAGSILWHMGTAGTTTHYPESDGVIRESAGTTVRKVVGNPTPALTSWRLYNVISTSAEFTANLDGTQLFTTATNVVGLPAAPRLGHSASSASFVGQIAEFIVCNAKLSTPDRTSMKAYIATKYGLTIA